MTKICLPYSVRLSNLGLDSIDALELVTMIFEVFGYDVPAEDVKKLYSVNAVAEYLSEHGICE